MSSDDLEKVYEMTPEEFLILITNNEYDLKWVLTLYLHIHQWRHYLILSGEISPPVYSNPVSLRLELLLSQINVEIHGQIMQWLWDRALDQEVRIPPPPLQCSCVP